MPANLFPKNSNKSPLSDPQPLPAYTDIPWAACRDMDRANLPSFTSCRLSVVMRDAQPLQVSNIPEQNHVASMRFDVIDYLSCSLLSLLVAINAERILGEKQFRQFGPAAIVSALIRVGPMLVCLAPGELRPSPAIGAIPTDLSRAPALANYF